MKEQKIIKFTDYLPESPCYRCEYLKRIFGLVSCDKFEMVIKKESELLKMLKEKDE